MTEEKVTPEKTVQDIMAERKQKQTKTDEPSQKSPPIGEAKSSNWSLRLLLILMVFILGAGVSLYFLPFLKDRLPFVATWVGDSSQNQNETMALRQDIPALKSRLTQQGAELDALKTDMSGLSQRVADLPLSSPVSDEKTDTEVLERLESLEQARLKASSTDETTAQSARIDMLLNRMSQLEASFVPLSKGLSDAQTARLERSGLMENSATQSDKINEIEQRLTTVERYAARDNSGALLAFRIGALRRKVSAGQPFEVELAALHDMAQQGSLAVNDRLDQAITWLRQHEKGITPQDKLRDQFDHLIPNLIRASSGSEDDPWWVRAYHSTKNLIMVRKTNKTSSAPESASAMNPLDEAIADTQQFLNRFDVEEAVSLLKQLPKNIQEILQAWLLEADIYLRAEEELDQIESLTAAYYLDPSDKTSKSIVTPMAEKDSTL